MGWFGKWAVDISVLGCNLGVCAGYMVFIASNLQVSYGMECVSLRVGEKSEAGTVSVS